MLVGVLVIAGVGCGGSVAPSTDAPPSGEPPLAAPDPRGAPALPSVEHVTVMNCTLAATGSGVDAIGPRRGNAIAFVEGERAYAMCGTQRGDTSTSVTVRLRPDVAPLAIDSVELYRRVVDRKSCAGGVCPSTNETFAASFVDAGSNGCTIHTSTIDPHVGGAFRIAFTCAGLASVDDPARRTDVEATLDVISMSPPPR